MNDNICSFDKTVKEGNIKKGKTKPNPKDEMKEFPPFALLFGCLDWSKHTAKIALKPCPSSQPKICHFLPWKYYFKRLSCLQCLRDSEKHDALWERMILTWTAWYGLILVLNLFLWYLSKTLLGEQRNQNLRQYLDRTCQMWKLILNLNSLFYHFIQFFVFQTLVH